MEYRKAVFLIIVEHVNLLLVSLVIAMIGNLFLYYRSLAAYMIYYEVTSIDILVMFGISVVLFLAIEICNSILMTRNLYKASLSDYLRT